MLSDIKEMLIGKPDAIVSLLEEYDYSHIHLRETEIRFARDDDGGQNIRIKLKNNDNIYVTDFVQSSSKDIIAYIMENRNVTFVSVLKSIKKILSLSDDWRPAERGSLFCGFYDSIGKDRSVDIVDYPDSIMDKYEKEGNKRWFRDGISLETQRKYCVCYDKLEDLIVFPWRDPTNGMIMAVKARINYPQEEGMSKYYYVKNGPISQSLFNYTENYKYLVNCERLIVAESEKTCMILDGWGIHSSVAVGSHSVSDQQAKLIMSLDPKEVWFMMDKDLPIEETNKNIKAIKKYMMMKDCKIRFWNWTKNKIVCEKGAPVDMGRSVFEDICKNEMECVK